MKKLLIALSFLALAGCEVQASGGREEIAHGVSKFVDHDEDVTCWVLIRHQRGGLSCIPNSQLRSVNQ